jgi:Virulence factor BrkB
MSTGCCRLALTVLAVEALYSLARNVKQRFLATLPEALLSVGCWIGLSYLLGLYFRTFANFNKTYRTLGAGRSDGLAVLDRMLVGAELNARAGEANQGKVLSNRKGSTQINEAHRLTSRNSEVWDIWTLRSFSFHTSTTACS